MSIKISVYLKLLANPKYKPKEPWLMSELDGDHPKARKSVFEGKGKFVDMPDYALEHLMEEILDDPNGRYLSMMKDILVMAKLSSKSTYISDQQKSFNREKNQRIKDNKKMLDQYQQELDSVKASKEEVKNFSKEDIIEMIISELEIKDYHSAIKLAVLGIFNRMWNIKKNEIDSPIREIRLPKYLADIDLNKVVKTLREISNNEEEFRRLIERLSSVIENIGSGRKFDSHGREI